MFTEAVTATCVAGLNTENQEDSMEKSAATLNIVIPPLPPHRHHAFLLH